MDVVKTDDFYISSLDMPDPIRSELRDDRLEEAKATYQLFESKVSEYYDISDSWLRIAGPSNEGVVYQWVFVVEKGEAKYELVYDAFGEV